MYGILPYIYYKNQPNVCKHGHIYIYIPYMDGMGMYLHSNMVPIFHLKDMAGSSMESNSVLTRLQCVDEPDGSAGTPSDLAQKLWQLRCICRSY